MKWMFLLFLLIPLAGQVYASWHVWQMLPTVLWLRMTTLVLMSLAFVLFFVALSGALDHMPMTLATVVYEVGESWPFILLYLVMAFLLLDTGRLVHLVPRSWLYANSVSSIVLTVAMVLLFGYANWHYHDKKRVEVMVESPKISGRPLRLVLVSDLHLGYHNSRSDLHRWLKLIRAECPDAILIAGDIIDGSIRPVDRERMAEEFRALGIPVYAAFGNHDYYTGVSEDLRFCHEAGITLLRDSSATMGDLAIVGRDDRTNLRRLPLAEVMRGIDRSKYIIELDHQPYHLEEAERCGVDFEFAGHTHYGQVWPISWITDAIYEDAFGPLRKGHTDYYVSSGLGIWGGKFRIGTQSEYIVLTLKGVSNESPSVKK